MEDFSATGKFVPAEIQLMALVLSKNTSPITVDWNEIAALTDYKNGGSAAARWRQIKQNKLGMGSAPSPKKGAKGDKGAGGTAEGGTPKSARGRKRKDVATPSDDAAGDDEETPTKKPKLPKKYWSPPPIVKEERHSDGEIEEES